MTMIHYDIPDGQLTANVKDAEQQLDESFASAEVLLRALVRERELVNMLAKHLNQTIERGTGSWRALVKDLEI
ncbi:MAG: hypothetical protein H8D74_01275 [Chloroflexi bacterium]|nr:hypothetical protein [Chloroflexota bacterium]